MQHPRPILPNLPAAIDGLPALTMTAPWGTAIMRWGKPWENRGWAPPQSIMGMRIGIHQGKVPLTIDGWLAGDKAGRAIKQSYDAIQRAGLCPEAYDAGYKQAFADSRMLLGTCVVLDYAEVFDDHAISRWASPGERLKRDPWMIPGGFSWHVADPELLPEPLPMRGLQKLWTINKDLVLSR